jgi:DNA modification methylase
MKPYYEEPGITIYCADCREVLPHLPKVDLVLTDPPYGILSDSGSAATRRSGNRDDGKMPWDCRPDVAVLDCIVSVAPVQMIWGGIHLLLPPTFGYLVWDKQIDGLNFGEAEICWSNLRFAPRIFRYRAVCVDGGKVHPTQKPLSLMRWCLGFAPNAQTILDPFMGSGTTLVAAKQLGRRAIGIEIERKYCDIAIERLRQEVLPLEPEAAQPEQMSL